MDVSLSAADAFLLVMLVLFTVPYLAWQPLPTGASMARPSRSWPRPYSPPQCPASFWAPGSRERSCDGWPAGAVAAIGWMLQTKGLIMIVFTGILLDKRLISQETFTALSMMAIVSTNLAVPMVSRKLKGIPKCL